jgi:hypothetical protein
MTDFNTRLMGALDAAAEKTGIPTFSRRQSRRRRFRLLPLIVLLLGFCAAGYGVAGSGRWGLTIALMGGIQSVASVFLFAGPLRSDGSARLDELDRRLYLHAYLTGLICVAALALAGIVAIAFCGVFNNWPPVQMAGALCLLAFLMFITILTVPTLHASWAMEPLDDAG